MEIALAIGFVGLLVFLAHLFSALFERTRIPDVLPLVVLGLLIGPILKLITPEAFGKVGPVFTTISLVIILFQSGLGLNLATLRESLLPGMRLTVLNFIGTVLVVAVIATLGLRMSALEGMILGAIIGGTSSAVVIPLIGRRPLRIEARAILLLESTFSDVLCIVTTLALVQAVRYHELQETYVMRSGANRASARTSARESPARGGSRTTRSTGPIAPPCRASHVSTRSATKRQFRRPLCRAFRRAKRTARGSLSTPMTSAKRSASGSVKNPTPQKRSSARSPSSPAVTRSSNSASRKRFA